MASITNIIKEVKVILDENENITNGNLDLGNTFADPDQLQTDEIIRTLIPIAVDKVHKLASEDMIQDAIVTAGSGGSSSVTWTDYETYCSKATLPDDFIRVTYVKLGGWKRGAVRVLSENDPMYGEFFSNLAGVRPSTIYPSVAIVSGASGMEIVACPKSTGSSSGTVRYVQKASSTDDEIMVASKCYYALLYCVAYLYYITINEKQRADMMAAECTTLLGVESNNLANV